MLAVNRNRHGLAGPATFAGRGRRIQAAHQLSPVYTTAKVRKTVHRWKPYRGLRRITCRKNVIGEQQLKTRASRPHPYCREKANTSSVPIPASHTRHERTWGNGPASATSTCHDVPVHCRPRRSLFTLFRLRGSPFFLVKERDSLATLCRS